MKYKKQIVEEGVVSVEKKNGFVIWNEEYNYYTGSVLYSSEFSVNYITHSSNKEDAKIYSSEKRALSAAKKLVERCWDFNSFEIHPY